MKEEVIEYDVDDERRVLGEDDHQWWICGLEDGALDGMNLTFQASDAKKPLLSPRCPCLTQKANQSSPRN